ncbi:glycosyltransferase family 87 protein [Trinickia sp. EG282A]|uniref:glycosyltransferase family 87 protein n=1 Tax=Trinickia sp. EG282A TaxID=3237013 RepID=UPI0034D27984
MYLLSRGAGASDGDSSALDWLTARRLVFCSYAAFISYVGFVATWAWVTHGFTGTDAGRPGLDFSIFWTASHLMRHESPALVYDHQAFVKATVTLFGGFANEYGMPWLYPPAFLVGIAPLSLLPFPISYIAFVSGSVVLFVVAALSVSRLGRSVQDPRLAALFVAALPCVFVTAIIGQNSLLTAALAASAVRWLAAKPVLAGICIGLLAIKPQMAIVFPFVLIAAQAWRTFAAAALSGLAFTTLGALTCGARSFHAFLVNASVMRSATLEHGQHFWMSSPSPFSALRSAGIPVTLSYVVHGMIAIVAIAAACQVWRRSSDMRLRASMLAASTLIVNPYVWHYELAWLGIALACVTACGINGRWYLGEQGILVAGWLLPVYEHFNRVAKLPQIGPAVVLLTMLVILRRVRMVAGVKL